MEAVKVAPNRHELQCRMWDCTRITPNLYCTFGHGFRSRTEEEKREAVVYVDVLNVDKEASLSLKILNTKSQGLRCGVPTLATNVLQGNPWAFPNVFDFNLMEDETMRNLAFISETVLPSNIWVRYNTRTVLGMERISWRLRPPPAVGRCRLRRYRLPNYVNSLYWLSYEQNRVNKGTGKTVSVPVPDTQKEGPPDPGAGAAAGPSTEPQLRGFMGLSLNHYVPLSLLILSRAFMVSGRVEDAVRATLSIEISYALMEKVEFYNTMVERAAVRESDGDQAAEADEISYALMEKMDFYNTMVERAAVRESDGDQAAEADEISYAQKVDGLMQNREKENS